jgi:hypothetical protein
MVFFSMVVFSPIEASFLIDVSGATITSAPRRLKRVWLDEPVGFEPVSNPNSLFCRFGPASPILVPSQRANSIACSQIPYATEQGIFPAEQGINFKEQGISGAKIESVVGSDFR